MAQRVLVVDVGGTHLKILANGPADAAQGRFGTKDDSRADVQRGNWRNLMSYTEARDHFDRNLLPTVEFIRQSDHAMGVGRIHTSFEEV